MEEYVMKLATIDYFSLVSTIVIIMVALVALKELLEKFCKMVGIEFSWIRDKRERLEFEAKTFEELETLANRQEELERLRRIDAENREKFNKNMEDNMESLKDDILSLSKSIELREAKKTFKKLRFDILDFADRIARTNGINSEYVEQIYSEIETYRELEKQYGFENGQASASIAVIQKKYEELLLEGKIIKGDD